MPKVKSRTPRNAVEIETWQFSKPSETFGQLVFAKMNGSLWWPGVVIDGQEWGFAMASLHKQWIFWYGDGRVSQIMVHNICSFRKFYKKLLPAQAGKKYREGIEEAIDDCAFQDGMPSSWDKKEKLNWADNGFESQSTKLELSADLKKSLENVKKVMANYKENESEKERKQYLKEKRMPEGRVEKKRLELVGVKHSHIQSNSLDGGGPKMSLFQKIQNGKVNPKEVCIACRCEKKIIQCQHPVFEGGICDECKIACAVCAHTGEVIVCDKPGCTRVYCVICLHELAAENAISKFKQQNPWHCMVCRGYDHKSDGCLRKIGGTINSEKDVSRILMMCKPLTEVHTTSHTLQLRIYINESQGQLTHSVRTTSIDLVIPSVEFELSPVRVPQELSLLGPIHDSDLDDFDGSDILLFKKVPYFIGYYSLSQLGFHIDAYYALEIDSNAINVSQMNFGDKIIQLGDVEKFTYDKIASLCPFDLVIGGSPCNDLSAVNPARKGLYDPDGTGRLFFEYYRVLATVQSLSLNPVFWFYENVASMPIPCRHIISRFLNCEPCLIDAKHFSAQRRPRFYWGNIPGLTSLGEFIPNYSPTLSSAVISNCRRKAVVDKLNTITTRSNSLKPGNQHPVIMDGELTNIWVTELEQVFGFPCHFTDVGNLLPHQRLGLLGKSWSVPVISNILSSLKHFFLTKPVVASHH